MLDNIRKYIFFTLLLLIPTQIALHFWPTWAYVFGLRIDFLAPAVYLTDILIGLLIIFNLKVFRTCFESILLQKYLTVLFVLALFNIFMSTSLPESIFRWLRLLEFILFGVYIKDQRLLRLDTIVKTVFYSSAAFSIIGISQFLLGRTVGGLFYWLGERSFNLGTPGIALISLNGIERLRAYSTFSHPNSLAGFLGAVLIFALLSGVLKKNLINVVSVVLISVCFFLTFSLSAYFGLLVVLFFVVLSKNQLLNRIGVMMFLFSMIIFSLLMPVLSPNILENIRPIANNISERLDLAYTAGSMIGQRFLYGVGLGTFIINVPGHRGEYIYSWLLQPVHNIYLLVLSEVGIFGLLFFCLFLYKLIRKALSTRKFYLAFSFVFLIFTGMFDHYSLTLQQNILLFSLFAGLTLR